MFGFGNMFPEPLRPFNTMYKCYSVSMLPGNERTDVEKGGKIIMPPSALDQLTRLNISYPMLFKLTNNSRPNRVTHCGVLEFVADEGKVYLPYWMMRNLLLDEGSMIRVESTSLPVATFSKFQPQSVDFLDITNPKAVLENALRNFACLTSGDVIAIDYNSRVYELCVLETKPGNAVSIIECDMNVDFEAPVGYQEPTRNDVNSSGTSSFEDAESYLPSDDDEPTKIGTFEGAGFRLDGKLKPSPTVNGDKKRSTRGAARRGIPDYNYQVGLLRFNRLGKPAPVKVEEAAPTFQAFGGTGQTLHKRPGTK